MAKTVENALQVNILKISKAARSTPSGCMKIEWVCGGSVVVGIVMLADHTVTILVGGSVYQAPISRREFRKDRYLAHIQCLACGRKCFSLFVDGAHLKCRRCAGLIYECQRGHAPERAMIKAQKILARLGGLAGYEVPARPVGMWRRTYLRHLHQLVTAREAAFGRLSAGHSNRD
ncbi:hypothetical protein [Noviherbaspirillum autotrophicum]|uniref:Uncharacterized protein n=1 Tax=Noviherbaspirillum autotrophicum TaxID=709839 RepID=A0A0C1Y8M1_9BURK|nr:hypothetical protein [Noviherbaspirillum autotrophicum]KIF83283.1 hypothetical protein TSA66_24565 [Noviherbaspirillum autotrophicum]